MTQVTYVKDEKVSSSLESGRSLALNLTQVTSLKDNFRNQIPKEEIAAPQEVAPVQDSIPVVENAAPSLDNIAPVEQEIPQVQEPVINDVIPTVAQEVQEPIIENQSPVAAEEQNMTPDMSAPVIDLGIPFDSGEAQSNVQSEPVTPGVDMNPVVDFTPVVDIAPVQEASQISQETVMPQVEIVTSNNKQTEYDVLTKKILEINKKYDDQMTELNRQRQEEIKKVLEENKQSIVDLQDKAEEHLKNAQAAEQIAHIAYENAQNVVENSNVIN